MRREIELADHAQYSEKAIEAYLVKRAKEEGGKALKYFNPSETGYPDRLLILPGCLPIWIEVKSHGKKPRPIQMARIKELLALGQPVMVADSKEIIDNIIKVAKTNYKLEYLCQHQQ